MIRLIILFVVTLFLQSNIVMAANKSCVVIPFSDTTFYAGELKTNDLYADLILEKIINNNLFIVKETRIIDDEKARLLVDGSYADVKKMQGALMNNNFDAIFDSDRFYSKEASDIKSATLGQYVSPEIVKEIGILHGVDYLLHGTVTYVGVGSDNHNTTNDLINAAGGALKFFTGIGIGRVDISSKGVVVECDLRLIETDTGKVVWYNKNKFMSDKKNISVGDVKVGNKNYNSDMYFNAVDGAAKVNIELLANFNK